MMEKQQIADAIRSATQSVFSMMLGFEVIPGEAYTELNAPPPRDGIIAVIGMAGAWIGTGNVSCSGAAACLMTSQMLGTEYQEVNEDVLDAISEIANMIIGGFKTSAESHLGALGLSIPTVIYGLSFSARTVGKEQWVVVPFTGSGIAVEVKICLTPNRGLPHLAVAAQAQTARP